MDKTLLEHIVERVPYWYRSRGPDSMNKFASETVNELLGRFVVPNEQIFWYGHDIFETVMQSHPLVSAYFENDDKRAKNELSQMLMSALNDQTIIFSEDSLFIDRNFRRYGEKNGIYEPFFPANISSPQDAFNRTWFDLCENKETFSRLELKKERIRNKKVSINTSLEGLREMNASLKNYFPNQSELTHFLKDAALSSERVSFVVSFLRPERRNNSQKDLVLLPYSLVVGYEALSSVINHSIDSMSFRIRNEVYMR